MTQGEDNFVVTYASLAEALTAVFGESGELSSAQAVYGGDTASCRQLVLRSGQEVFLKLGRSSSIAAFVEEARGLKALRETGALLVPEVLALGVEEGRGFLLLSYVDNGSERHNWEELGQGLARLHEHVFPASSSFYLDGSFGFSCDNFIGRGRQRNTPHSSWVEFFAKERLLPMYEQAKEELGRGERECFERLLTRLPDWLGEPSHPSLLHGDLWMGNVLWKKDSGRPVLIDPAVYFGHPEADLAMTELFGGFAEEFYRTYQACHPLEPGYEKRRDIYNLYHLLNHLNLFGEAYLPDVRRILLTYGRP
ncbi:MAG: fructosamine kinase family protein [Blautia sp.]|nr:fructosamine kinase family protein [Blautia sp.]